VPHTTGKRIQVRRSGVHGKGVFALQDIAVAQQAFLEKRHVGNLVLLPEAP
jgi:hypothetical protein